MLKIFDTFSGIGGFSLGLESTGFYKTIAFCEQDEFCQTILKKHWPDVPIFSDIKDLDYQKLPDFDVLTGGVPCQPFSIAGKKKGTEDDRHLWPSMLEIITRKRPSVVIIENVTGIISIFLDQLLLDLENENYTARSFVLPAIAFDAPHRRDRIWIIAYSKSNVANTTSKRHSRGPSTRSGEISKRHIQQNKQKRSQVGSKISRCSNVSDTDKQRTQVQTKGKQPSIKLSGSKSKETWWETESRICGVPDGVSYGVDRNRAKRIKALGNSIVPQIIESIGYAVAKDFL